MTVWRASSEAVLKSRPRRDAPQGPQGRSPGEPCSRSSDTPCVIFLNPWDRLIGPNRYLVEMLRHAPELAVRSTVVFAAGDDACREYRDLGCRTEVWPEVGLIHPRLTLGNVASNLQRHTVGLARVVRRLKDRRPDLVVSNSEILCLGGMAARAAGIPRPGGPFPALSVPPRGA
jgi:hypothetical protein